MEELKKIIEALGRAFEEFRAANDTRLKQIEARGAADPLLTEKVEKANADISGLLAMKAQLEKLGASIVVPERRTSEYLAKFVQSDIAKWGAAVKASGIEQQ